MDIETLKSRLLAEKEELLAVSQTSKQAANVVELDQTRVGRLSRMDAMQAQAMSVETGRRREIQLSRIESALKRIADGTYGDCLRCGEPIDENRIAFNPSVLMCIDCAANVET